MINHGFIVTRALLEERKRSRSISKKMLGIYQLEWKALISIEMEWKALSSLRLILKTSKQYFGKKYGFPAADFAIVLLLLRYPIPFVLFVTTRSNKKQYLKCIFT